MRISASEFILFCNSPLENVRRLSAIVPEVELMMDGDAWEHDQNGWAAQAKMLEGINVPMSAHPPAWDVNPAAPLLALREAASFLNKKALEFCVGMGIKQMVYHPGYYDRDSFFSLNRAKDHAYQLLDELVALAKPAGITLAFENIGGPTATLFTQEEFIHALDGIDPCVQLLLDVGHANMNGWNIPEVIDRTAGRLCALHLHDNDGTCDAHLPMGQGNINWTRTFASMRQLPDSCVFIMEYQSGTDLEKLAEGRDMLLDALG